MSDIPVVTLQGRPEDRGYSYGKQLAGRIHATWEFYWHSIFLNSPLDSTQIRDRALQLRDLIGAFNPAYPTELEAIARGADLEPWQIYALNARTEVLNAPLPECTSLYFQESALLGQTWDWIRQLEDLMVVIRYADVDGRNLVTLTEPGILAKIGMNDAGLGVCLNILIGHHQLDGIPVHIVLRAILECATLEEARDVIKRSGYGKSSHFLIGDAAGQCYSIEFCAGRSAEVKPRQGRLVHTNHCVAEGLESEIIPTTLERLAQADAGLAKFSQLGLEEMQHILLHRDRGSSAIQSSYRPEAMLGGLEVGTCATIVMDLKSRRMHLKKGPTERASFTSYEVP